MEQDYYQLLEVERTANVEEIKKSYRRLAMQCHPDKNPGDKAAEEKFKKICEAYEVLKDDQKRAAYDRYGHDAFKRGFGMGGGSGMGGFEFNFGAGGFSDMFSEIFSEFMGGGSSRNPAASYAQNGSDLRYDIDIDLKEAFFGLDKEIRYSTTTVCEECHGHGTANGKEAPLCPYCQGRGKVRQQQGGFFFMETVCPKCRGKGRVVETPCKKCRGMGAIKLDKALSVKIPSGIEDGTRMRIAGAGEAGLRGGRNGDLYVFIRVKQYKLYQREGTNLYAKVPISFTTAALGGVIELPGIDGSKVKVAIEPGTQNEQVVKVKNQGMSQYKSNKRGDLFVGLKVETPVNLTSRQKELLKEFESLSKDSCNPENQDFWGKVKKLFE